MDLRLLPLCLQRGSVCVLLLVVVVVVLMRRRVGVAQVRREGLLELSAPLVVTVLLWQGVVVLVVEGGAVMVHLQGGRKEGGKGRG